MGLISLLKDVGGAGLNALGGTVQSAIWKEYFESGDMSDGILMKRANKVLTDKGKNRKADDNLISNGSGIDVQEGQCMIIVENGKIVEFCCEPGRYTYDTSTQPSIICNSDRKFFTMLKEVGKEALTQWSAGGQRFASQRVYFINMGEIIATPIKWGCGDIAFHHTQVYRATGSMLELDMTLRANGQCTIQIEDPIKFFRQIGAQKAGTDGSAIIRVTDEGIYSNLKSNIIDHISSAIATLGYEQQIPYTAIKAKSADIAQYLNAEIQEEWVGKRGFGIANFSINGSPIPSDENKKQLEEMQNSFNMSQNANAMNYDIQKTMARGFEAAGHQEGGGDRIFGMGMAMHGMGGGNFGNIQNQMPQGGYGNSIPTPTPAPAPAPKADEWSCSCGAKNSGVFCTMCGSKKPAPNVGTEGTSITWDCACGNTNGANSRFCSNCGAKKPIVKKLVCDKCGWKPEEGQKVRFCPNCGDIINDADFVE